ncbi:MAG: pitrilysin family protein [bacterium]|nr:pitrilysin family protein [bacterium]
MLFFAMKKAKYNKKSIFKLIFIGIIVLVTSKVFSSSFISSKEAFKTTLDNGLTVIIKEVHSSPVVAARLWLSKGSVDEGKYLGAGISHFIEHMFFKGTKIRATTEVANTIREVGGDLNGFTSYNYTCYDIDIPSKYYERAIDVLSDMSINSIFDPQELEKEREVILKELSMNIDDHDRYLSNLLWSTAYTTHPYKYPIIGLKDRFIELTRQDLVSYYQEVYIPANLILVLVGNLKTEEALTKVKEYFSKLKPTIPLSNYIPQEPKQMGLRVVEEERETTKTYLAMGYHGSDIRSPDVYALDLLANLLGEGRSSLFYKILREKKQLVYDVSTYSYTPKQPGIFGIKATLEPKFKEETMQEILSIIEQVKIKGFSEEEISKGKKMVIADQIFQKETIKGWAQELALNELSTGNIDFGIKYVEGIKKVTNSDIKNVAKKYLNQDNLTIATIIPKKSKDREEIKIKELPQAKIKKKVLKNGITLLIHESKANPVVCLNAMFLGGVRSENKENNGICNLTTSLLIKGTKSRTAEKISQEIESVGGNIKTYSVNNYCGCSVDALAEDFDLALDILSDVICNPVFPKEEIEKEKKVNLALIKSRYDHIFGVGKKLIEESLWKKHPYRLFYAGNEESLKKMKQEDIKDFHKKYFSTSNMIFSVFGDIKEEEVVRKVEKAFARLEATRGVCIKVPQEEKQKEMRKIVEYRDQEQTLILLGYHSVPLKHPDMLVFEVLSSILNGQGSRLFYELRDKKSLAYYVGTFSYVGVDPGAYIFYIGTVEDKIEESTSDMFKEIEKLKKEYVLDKELDKAKKDVVTSRLLNLQSNASKALDASSNEILGLGYDYTDKLEDLVGKISKEDIQRIANEYFKEDNLSLVIVKPKEK